MPTKDRQRQLARAKLERQMARRAAAAKRRRQTQAAVGAGLALLLVIAGAVFLVAKYGGSDDDNGSSGKTTTASGGAKCTYQKADSTTGKVKDTGTPPATGVADSGNRTVTMTTNLGQIDFTLDQAAAPCTSNSFAFLAGKKFYDGTSCHRLVTTGIFVLQCGDPFGDGTGGPSYRFGTENLPAAVHPPYPAGTIAMAKSSAAISVGSQFFIVYKDIPEAGLPADYTVVGKVTKGLDLVVKAAAKGSDNSNGNGDGKPKQPVKITTLKLSAATS